MEISAEVPIDVEQVKESVPRAHEAWVLGISVLISIWTWAAFVHGHGHRVSLQLLFMIGSLASLGIFRWFVSHALCRHYPFRLSERNRILAYCYSAFLLLAAFLPEYLLGRPPQLVKSVMLLGLSLLLFTVYLAIAIRFASPPGETLRLAVTGGQALLGFCFIYFCLTTYLSIAKLHAFGYVGQDIAYFTQCLYTTLHGHLFYSNLYHDLLYSQPVNSDFAGHNQLVLALFLPFYLLHQSASTLLVVRNLSIVLCAWPIYLIARRTVSPWVSAVAAIAFLFMPAVFYQNVYDFAPLSLAGLPLLFALYYFLEVRFKPFVIALVLTQAVREDLVFAVFGFGLLALFQRRKSHWVVFPCSLAILWAWLSWKIVFPHFLHGSTSAVASCFAYMGAAPSQIVRYVTRHPGTIFSRNNLVYLKQLIDSFGGVLFLPSPIWLASLPYVAINLLAEGGGCNTAMVYRHYAMIPTVLLFGSYLFSLDVFPNFLGRTEQNPQQLKNASVVFVLFAALSGLVFVTGRMQLDGWRRLPWHDEARRISSLVPGDASVAVPRYMLPGVANRSKLYQSLRLLEYHRPDAQYVVLDKDWKRMAATERWRDNYYLLWHLLEANRQYVPIYDSPNYVIYQRCDGCPNSLPHLEPKAETRE